MSTPRRLGALLILGLLALAAACASPTATPTVPARITLTDSEGTTVSLQGPAQQIISLGPANTEILYALDAGDRVVGVDDYSDYPTDVQDKPKVGAPFPSFSLETILSLEPDLVLSVSLVGFNEQLRSHGLKVLVLESQSLEEVMGAIELVGRAVGAEERAAALVTDMRQRITAVSEQVQDAQRVRVFYEVDATDHTKPYTVGPGSFVHSLITLAGGENIFVDAASPYPKVNLETVVARDPEVILLGDAMVPYNPQTPEMVADRSGWGVITAIQQNAIIEVDGDLTTRPGPRIVEGLEVIARALHPELFP